MADLSRGKAELVKIRDLVLQDSVTLTKWGQIVDHAIKLAADQKSIKAKLRGQDPNYAEAVLQTLEIWNSCGKGIQVELLTVLETYDLNLLAALEFQSGNATGEGEEDSIPGPSQQTPMSSTLPNLAINFVERESKLEELHELVTRPCGHNKSAYALLTGLYGLGGIGKTTLARRYVDYFKHKDRFPGASLFWIESETNSTLRIAFRHLAKTLGVPEFDKLDTKVLVESVYNRVHSLTCLFVFDNVTEYDGPDGIYTFLPHPIPGPYHYILATSRKADLLGRVGANDRILQLVLSESEADELVRKALPNSCLESRQQLWTTLGRLPLALQQAISYVFHSRGAFANESCAIEEYVRDFNDNSRKLELLQSDVLNEDGRKNEKTVYVTWQTTLATIARQEHGELAVKLLQAMAYMNSDNIDLNFLSTLDLKFTFLSTLKDKLSLTLSKITKKRMNHAGGGQLNENYSTRETETVRAAVLLLSKYSMATLQDGFVSVHRLVQDVARLTMSDHNWEECVMLFRIIRHIYQCRDTNLVEQCALHGAAVVPFYGRYTHLKRYFPDFAEIVFEEKRLHELVLKRLATKNRAAALNLIVNLQRTELAIEAAMPCIGGMEGKSALETYVRTLTKVARDKTYSRMDAVTIANWLVVSHDTSDTLSSLIMRLLPYLERSALSSGFFCELLKANEHVFHGAVKKFKQYGIDMKTVSLPTKNQIQDNWKNE